MKKLLSLFLVLSLALCVMPVGAVAAEALPINSKNFPDKAFRDYVEEEVDIDKDGSLSAEELSAVRQIYCENMGIRSLEGIEHFVELMDLFCGRNEIEKLDLRENKNLSAISCDSNAISELLLPDVDYMHQLSCRDNLLAKLDLSRFGEIMFLDCRYNRIEELKLPTERLFSLELSGNPLGTLEMPDYNNLETLVCTGNGLEELDVSGLPALYTLDCSGNEIAVLEFVENSSLYELKCSDNKLEKLDLSKNDNLGVLDFSDNPDIQELYISPKAVIYTLECRNCELEGIGLEDFTELSHLDCSGNAITQLELENNKNLKFLYCSGNKLESLDLSGCKYLTEFVCRGEEIKDLILPENDSAAWWETGLELALEPVENADGAKGDKFNGHKADVDKNGNLLINEKNFPDRQFRLWLMEKYDKACRGYLSAEQIAQINVLNVGQSASAPFEIMSLEGVEFFSSIIRFESGELLPVEVLDLAKNRELYRVNIGSYMLEELYLPQTEKLRYVNVLSDKLKDLDVSGCSELEELYIYGPAAKSIGLSYNTKLK